MPHISAVQIWWGSIEALLFHNILFFEFHQVSEYNDDIIKQLY